MKIAKPRSSKSPNHKAFNSIKTSHTIQGSEITPNKPSEPSKPNTLTRYSDFLSPLLLPTQKPFDNKQSSYFSLGNTFTKQTDKLNHGNKLDKFVQRLSQQERLSDRYKIWVEQNKKRFSLENPAKTGSNYKNVSQKEERDK